MIKNLFISLIILSALAADGSVGSAGLIYDYLNLSNEQGLFEGVDGHAETSGSGKPSEASPDFYSGQTPGIFSHIPGTGTNGLEIIGITGDLALFSGRPDIYSGSAIVSTDIPFLNKDKTVIISKSDLSPPTAGV